MKNITLAAVFAMVALPAFSGNLSDPVVEPMVSIETIEAETVTWDHGLLVPLFALLFAAVAVSK